MKQFGTITLAAITLFAGTGCAAVSTRAPVTGFLYMDAAAGEEVTSNAAGSKTGEACASSILGLIGTGDASISTAAKEAEITRISHVDSKSKNILGVYATYCTIVHGD